VSPEESRGDSAQGVAQHRLHINWYPNLQARDYPTNRLTAHFDTGSLSLGSSSPTQAARHKVFQIERRYPFNRGGVALYDSASFLQGEHHMNIAMKQHRRNEVANFVLSNALTNEQLIDLAEKNDIEEIIEEVKSGRHPLEVYEESLNNAVLAGDILIEFARSNPQAPDSENGRLIYFLSLSIQRLILAYEQLVVAAYAKLFRSEVN
jgi:hypothetical protein